MSSVEAETRASAPPLEPYVGLTYFTEDRADRFFGRERESAVIISNLCAARLTLLYAESGVGKSSVLRAGVVARLHEAAAEELRAGGGAQVVPVVFSSWSERPVAALIRAIAEAIRPYLGEQGAPELPEEDLAAALDAAGEAVDGTIAVILDQFEEYFLYPDEEPEQDRIAAQIARCVKDPSLRANFLISIREDSYAELGDLFRGKVKDVYGNFLHLDFLDRAGAREAIEKPIERVNELQPESEPFTVEPALVDAVLDQVRRDEADEKVETTFLQLVMRRLWEEENRAGSHVLRLQTLEQLGGAQAIIGSHLDRAMEGGEDGGAGLTPEQRRTAAKIFRFLVTSGGTKIALTTGDLAELSGLSRAEIEPVLRHLSSPQLHILRPVVFQEEGSEPRFEIFHDALAEPIRKWRTKVEEEERRARRERERAEKEEAQRAAAAAERQAEQERRRKRIAQALLALAVIALVAGATIFAIEQKNLADQREADSQSVLMAERIGELAQVSAFGPSAAALASLNAYDLASTTEARNQALAQLQANVGMPKIAVGHTRDVEAIAYWPGSNDKLASGSEDGTVRLWNADGSELGSPLVAHSESGVEAVSVGPPDGEGRRIVAAAMGSEVVELWEVGVGGGLVRHLPLLEPAAGAGYWTVAFDPRVPGLLAVAGTGGRLTLWDLDHPAHPRPLDSRPVGGGVEDLAFAPNGRRLLVAGSAPGKAFAVSSSGFGAALPLEAGPAEAVAVAANGSYAFGRGSTIEAWDAARKRELHLRVIGDGVFGLAFAEGGSVLVSAENNWNVTTWDMATGRPFGPPRTFGHSYAADVAVSPDGRAIAGGGGRLVKIWPLRPTHPLATTVGALSPSEAGGHIPWFFDLAVGSSGRVAVAGGAAGTSIWSLRDLADPNAVPRPLARFKGTSYAVAYHGDLLVTPKGNSFAVYDTGKTCPARSRGCLLAVPKRPYSDERVGEFAFAHYGSRLLLVSTGYRGAKTVFNLWELSGVEKSGKIVHLSSRVVGPWIEDLALNPKKALLAVGPEDGKLRVWDISDPEHPRGIDIPHAHGNENQAVGAISFSRDGSLLATGGEDQQVVLWRVTGRGSGIHVKATPGTLSQGQPIFSLTFSSDGGTLAAGDGEGITCLYEVVNRRTIGSHSCLVGRNPGGEGGIEAAKFAHLGNGETMLLTAGRGQPIVAWDSVLWNLNDAAGAGREVTADVCRLAGRNLSEYEWRAVFGSTKLADERHPTCPE